MSRSGYHDDCDDTWGLIRWRGAVASSIKGKRGQKLLKELAEAMDAMPVKRLITKELKCADGLCTLGVIGEKRGIKVEDIDPEDPEMVAANFDIAEPLAREIVYLNDEEFDYCTPEERWEKMRSWVQSKIKASNP